MSARPGTHLKPRHAELLIALDDTRHLGRAAERLHMSQPAASKALLQLEEQVGYALFSRTPQGTQPTPAGTVMILHARHTLGSAVRVQAELQAAQLRGHCLLRLGTLPSAAATVAPALINALCGQLPTLEVTLLEGVLDDLLHKLDHGELDIVLGRLGGRALPAGCATLRLYDEPICVVAAAGHPLTEAGTLTLASVHALPWVLPLPGTMMSERLAQAFEPAGLTLPAARMQSNSLLATLAQVCHSDWLAAMPLAIARYHERQGLIRILPLRMQAHFGAIAAVYRRHAAPMPAVQAALDWLTQALVQSPQAAS